MGPGVLRHLFSSVPTLIPQTAAAPKAPHGLLHTKPVLRKPQIGPIEREHMQDHVPISCMLPPNYSKQSSSSDCGLAWKSQDAAESPE